MQISTPIQAPSSTMENSSAESGNIRENGLGEGVFGDSPVWGGKAQKRAKSGFFAKLLEGLTAKPRTGVLGSKSIETAEGDALEKMGKNSVKALSTSKKTKNSGIGQGLFNEEGIPGAVSVFFGQEKELNLALDPRAARKGAELPFEMDKKDDASGLKPAGLLLNQNEKGSPNWIFGKNLPLNPGSPNFVSLSFREMEAKFNQANGLANQTKPRDGEREKSRLSEIRSKRGRFNLEVRDFRTGQEAGEVQKGQFISASKPIFTETEIPVHVNLSGEREYGDVNTLGKGGKDPLQGRTFEDALARELREGLSNDIVRDAAVILRNGGEGTIRLALRPASLGDVKIRLEMTENKITGHIIVENSEALRAFERELPVLEKAFKDSGFSETNLEMSLAQDQGGWNFGTGEGRQEADFQAVSPVFAASRYEAETEWIEGPPSGAGVFSASMGRASVNLLI